MTYCVTILPVAKRQHLEQALWWSEHRSTERAFRWLAGFEQALKSLADEPERYSIAGENDSFEVVIRQLNFGLRNKPTHRAVFEVRNDEVIVFAVRHLAQRDLTPGDPPAR